MNNRGFSLLELLIYIAITTTISLCSCAWISNALFTLSTIRSKNEIALRMLAAFDCFARDIMMAPASAKLWKHMELHNMSWKQGDRIIEYQYKDGNVLRIVQAYNQDKNIYRTTKAKLITSISHCALSIHTEDKKVHGVTIAFSSYKGGIKHAYEQYIPLRNS